jgi:hypothetical protein
LYILATCIAGIAVYALVLRRSGAAAGILAAMLYVYSPYLSLVVPHVQGDLTEMLVLALTPALLWATDRLVRGHQPQNILFVALIIAALILTSPKGAMASGLLALAYAIWHFNTVRTKSNIFQFLVATGLGTLLASFYWIPALLEQSAIQWQPTISGATLTLRLSELVTPIKAIDPAEMIHLPQLTLGLVSVVFVVGSVLLQLFINRNDFGVFFLVSGLGITIIAVTLLRHETWLLGHMVLCFSVASSAILTLRTRLSARLQRLLLPILMVGIWIGSRASWLPPAASQPFGNTDGSVQVNYEQQGYGIAVLPAGDSLPSTLSNRVEFNHNLIDSYQAGTINKLVPGQLTTAFQASPLAHFVHGDQFQIRQVTAPVTLNFLTAFFPGWRATIGDQRLNLQPSPDTGLIQVDLPRVNSNNSELSITLGGTNVRQGSWLVAGLVLLIIVVLTWGKYRTLRKSSIEDLVLLQHDEARLIALPVGCFGLVALLILIPNPFLSMSQPDNTGMHDTFSTQMRSNTGLTMNGFRLTNNVYSGGDDFDITLFWQTQRFLPDNYRVKLFLKNNRDLSVWNETDLRNPSYYPTRRWNTQQYVPDRYDFVLAHDMTPGNYQIHLEVYDCTTICDNSKRIDFFNTDGQPLGGDVTLPTLISIRP